MMEPEFVHSQELDDKEPQQSQESVLPTLSKCVPNAMLA